MARPWISAGKRGRWETLLSGNEISLNLLGFLIVMAGVMLVRAITDVVLARSQTQSELIYRLLTWAGIIAMAFGVVPIFGPISVAIAIVGGYWAMLFTGRAA